MVPGSIPGKKKGAMTAVKIVLQKGFQLLHRGSYLPLSLTFAPPGHQHPQPLRQAADLASRLRIVMSWAPGTSHLAVPGLLLKPSTFFIPASNHSLFLPFLLTTSALLVAYFLSSAAYALTLHPLARFPGPRLCAASRLPLWYACITGHQVQWMHSLHTRYGPVVRYGPNDLSFVDEGDSHAAGSAWKAIHGHEKGETEFPKAKEWFVTPENGTSISRPRSLFPFRFH